MDKLKSLVLVGGVALGGYIVYEVFFSGKDPCRDDSIFGKESILGTAIPFNPLCEAKSIIGFFGGLVDIGVGVPVELEQCPSGWTNDGLTCREPISCAEGLDFFSEGCSGGKVIGRLDGGGTCPSSHPDKIDGLCYKSCPTGYVHTEGMPYTCRDPKKKDFFSALSGGFSPAITGLFE